MTPLETYLASVEEREKKATPGPWCWEQTGEKDNSFAVGVAMDENDKQLSGLIEYDEGQEIVECLFSDLPDATFGDAAFIAHSRSDIPRLLEIIRSQSKVMEAAQRLVDRQNKFIEAQLNEDGTPKTTYCVDSLVSYMELQIKKVEELCKS